MSEHKERSLDPISTALTAAAVKEAGGPVAAFIKSFGVRAYNSIAATFHSCFQGHVDSTLHRCSKMKNILYRDQSVDFLTQYVNVKFTTSKTDTTSDSNAISDAISGARLLICGTAGAGKTMFMRWSALRLIQTMRSHGRVPLFLEMRYFDEECINDPIEKYIFKKTSSKQDSASFDQFEQGLNSGLFIVLLDAIDEISPRSRDRVVSNVMDFMQSYPDCGLIISSRFDEKLESIQDFRVLRSRPMDLKQIVAVIEKLEYDKEVKDKLIVKLNGGLYEQLDEFLSNPLLATIMLLTFDHSADIPTKLTAFYQQAFEALYQRHDAAKGAYKRSHYAGLPIDRFQNIFSTFSFQTYLDYKFEFSDTDLSTAFSEACRYNGENIDPGLLIRDAMESVCLIQREGLDNVFSHRSFQEYFCALFISKYREAESGKLIEAVASMEYHSSVLRMLYELAPEAFEYEWVLPILSDYITKFGRVRFSTKTGLHKAFSAFCGELVVNFETGEIELIAMPSPANRVRSGSVSRWVSIIQSATQNHSLFLGALFNKPIWSDVENFISSLPDEIVSIQQSLEERATLTGRNNAKEISLYPVDCYWLIHSRLPELFDGMRSSIRQYHDEILQRRAGRQATVKHLLATPKRRKGRR